MGDEGAAVKTGRSGHGRNGVKMFQAIVGVRGWVRIRLCGGLQCFSISKYTSSIQVCCFFSVHLEKAKVGNVTTIEWEAIQSGSGGLWGSRGQDSWNKRRKEWDGSTLKKEYSSVGWNSWLVPSCFRSTRAGNGRPRLNRCEISSLLAEIEQ
jgi:hypothetical protein